MSLYRLVTLEEAKANMRYIGTTEDADLQRLVDDASQFVMNYLEAAYARARQYSGDDDVSDEDIAGYAAAFDGWTDSSGLPLVDSSGDPLVIDYDTDSFGDPVLDSDGNYVGGRSIIPGSVRRATLLVIAALDKDREGQTDPITPAVKSLLVRYRLPTAA